MGIKLGNICRFQSGGTPSKGKPEFFNGTIPWITTTALNGGNIGKESAVDWISEQAIKESAAKIVPAFSIMVGTRVGVGKVAINTMSMSTSQDIISLLDIDESIWSKAFLCKLLQAKGAFLNAQARGATIKGIKIDVLSELELPDIPIEEQQHISQIIDKVKTTIAIRQSQLQKLDELVKARFVEMFGNFVYERDRWSTCKIGDISDTIDPQPSHRTPPVSLDGIPYIGIAECNYKTLQIDFANARKVGQDVLQEHLNRYTLDKGDFIIGKIGTIGKPFFLPVKQTYTLSANTVLIKPNKLRVEPQFLFAVFQSEYMERIIDAEKKSTSQPAFGIQKVRKIDIPMPPLELQQQFAAFVEQANKSKVTVQKALDEAQLLFDSLIQKYFG